MYFKDKALRLTDIFQAARDEVASRVTYMTEAEAAACFSMQSTEAKAVTLKVYIFI